MNVAVALLSALVVLPPMLVWADKRNWVSRGLSASNRSPTSRRRRWVGVGPRGRACPPRPDLPCNHTPRRGVDDMANQLVIKGGTVHDGTGAAGTRADVGIADGRITEVGPNLEGDRVLDAGDCVVAPGLHRHPHALRRAGVLGPRAHAVVLPRRHDGGRRQLRVLDRADARRAPRAHRPHARERRGHGRRRARRGHPVGLRDLPRVPGVGRRTTASASTSPPTSATPRCACS